jgi:hypothetical protein
MFGAAKEKNRTKSFVSDNFFPVNFTVSRLPNLWDTEKSTAFEHRRVT